MPKLNVVKKLPAKPKKKKLKLRVKPKKEFKESSRNPAKKPAAKSAPAKKRAAKFNEKMPSLDVYQGRPKFNPKFDMSIEMTGKKSYSMREPPRGNVGSFQRDISENHIAHGDHDDRFMGY